MNDFFDSLKKKVKDLEKDDNVKNIKSTYDQ